MRLWSKRITVGLVLSLAGLSGCGQDPFGPPTRVRPATSAETTEKAKSIYFITAGIPVGEVEEWAREAQVEANVNHIIFRITGPGPNDPPSAQADVIRRSIGEDISGLIVVPAEGPEVGKALAEAQAKGIEVVLIGQAVAAPEGAKPFPVVDFAPLEPSAARIVSTVIADLKAAGRSAEGPVLILSEQQGDRTSKKRLEAMKAAVTAAGFTRIVELTLNSTAPVEAKKQLLDAVNALPDLAMILTLDAETLRLAGQIRQITNRKPDYFIGGYIDFAVTRTPGTFTLISCYAQGRYTQLANLAVKAILSRFKGDPEPMRLTLEPLFHREDPVDPLVAGTRPKTPIPASPLPASETPPPNKTEPPAAAPKP